MSLYTVDDITSFNFAIVIAERHHLLLNNFFQDDAGVWRCNWRTTPKPDGDSVWFMHAEHARPFDALRDALLMAINARQHISADAEPEPETLNVFD